MIAGYRCPFYVTVAVIVIFGVSCASGNNGVALIFSKIDVAAGILSGATTKKELSTFNEVLCVQNANLHPWCHLACFNDSGVCSLYDLQLPSNFRNNDTDLATDYLVECYTDQPIGCISDNISYSAGHSLIFGNCISATCNNGSWIADYGVVEFPKCPDGYESIVGVGCIMVVEILMNYVGATQHCNSLGAHLAMPNNYDCLKQFLLTNNFAGPSYYIGIYKNIYLNNRIVQTNAWDIGQPNWHAQTCASMEILAQDSYTLNDIFCSVMAYVICQLP